MRVLNAVRNDLHHVHLSSLPLPLIFRQYTGGIVLGFIRSIHILADGFNFMFDNLEEGTDHIDHDVTQIAHLPPEDVALVYGGDALVGYATPISEATITHSGETATINGRTQNLASIFQYARDLRASGGFSEVTIASITANEETLEAEGEEAEEVIRGYNFRIMLVQ